MPIPSLSDVARQGTSAFEKELPTGGTTGQVLSKTSNADYAVSWQTPATALTAAQAKAIARRQSIVFS